MIWQQKKNTKLRKGEKKQSYPIKKVHKGLIQVTNINENIGFNKNLLIKMCNQILNWREEY